MLRIALMEADEARDLFQYLKRKSIGVELQIKTDDSGLDFGELAVDDGVYDRACDIVEVWDAERRAAQERLSRLPCPKCHSRHVALVQRDTDGYAFRCKDCGFDYES